MQAVSIIIVFELECHNEQMVYRNFNDSVYCNLSLKRVHLYSWMKTEQIEHILHVHQRLPNVSVH